MPTGIIVPPYYVATAPNLPEGLSKKERQAQKIKNDLLVDKANKCIYRYWWNMTRLNLPKHEKNSFTIIKAPVFFIIVEFLEEVNNEWAKLNNLDDWFAANKIFLTD